MTSRQDSQVRNLSNELARSKTDRVVEMVANKRIRDLERDHLQEQQQQRINEMEKERSQMLDVANKRTHDRISDVVHQNEKIIHDTNRSNRIKQDMQSQQTREDRARLQAEMRTRVSHEQDQTDKRVRRIMNVTSEETQAQQKYHEKSLDQLKNNYADTLSNQREVQMEMIQDIRLRAEERMRERDVKATKKLEETISNYEAKIQKIQEDHKTEKNRLVEMYEQRMTQREKGFKTEQETLAMKYENKLSQTDDLRQKEIDRLERRHKEQMADLSNRMRYLNKKA